VNCSALIEIFEDIGKPVERWESSDGTIALVLPYGGRIIGLFPPGEEQNFLWTHPALEEAETAAEFYRSEEWHNSGGDRTWLAPEVDFFFPDFPDVTRYWQQRELDPGAYEVSGEGGALSWKNRATLTMSRPKKKIDVEITKSIALAPNPLGATGESEIHYAGYTLRTSLQLSSENESSQLGLWQLVQLPHGGEMLIPTLLRSEPKVYFGTIGPEDLSVEDRLVRYHMRANGGHKLGVQADALTGRAGYLYAQGDEVSLVIRKFNVNRSGHYIDAPWTETEHLGIAFQACNVSIDSVFFSELEYHAPAIGATADDLLCEDESQLWAFRGSWAAIRAVAQRLLSEEIGEESPLPN
jgi:hypothetical protein